MKCHVVQLLGVGVLSFFCLGFSLEPIAAAVNKVSSAEALSLGDYRKAIDDCQLDIQIPRIVGDYTTGTLDGLTYFVIRPDQLLLQGNTITIPIALTTDSDKNQTYRVTVRSVPFDLISTTANQATEYNVTELTKDNPETICHEFKATWNGRWSVIVDVRPSEVLENDTATLDIQIADAQFWTQLLELRRATEEISRNARDALIAAAVGTAAIAVIMLVQYIWPRNSQ